MLHTAPSEPLYQYEVDAGNQGIYVLIGTNHGQGTAQFTVRPNLGTSQQSREVDCADFMARSLLYATIKCKKDPYSILQLTSEIIKQGIKTTKAKQLVAIMDEEICILRTMWIDTGACNFHIASNAFITTSPHIRLVVAIPPELQGRTLRFKVIINSFCVMQVGDSAAQMSLQGREGTVSYHCVKYNLTQKE